MLSETARDDKAELNESKYIYSDEHSYAYTS